MRDLNAACGLNLTIITGRDRADSMPLLTSGRAEAFFEDDILLARDGCSLYGSRDLRAQHRALQRRCVCAHVSENAPDFKKVVDRTLTDLFPGGEIKDIYDQRFLKPIPPRHHVLNFQMPSALLKAIAEPTDSPDPAAY